MANKNIRSNRRRWNSYADTRRLRSDTRRYCFAFDDDYTVHRFSFTREERMFVDVSRAGDVSRRTFERTDWEVEKRVIEI
jgi:hypothetical protein